MAKQYYIKKDPSASGPDIEWVAINGKEFYQLITSPAGKGRYFIDMDDFMIETAESDYIDWRKEKNHSDYLRLQEHENQLLSTYSDITFPGGSGEDVVDSESISTEDCALHLLELDSLTEALKMLEDSEYRLIHALFFSAELQTQSQLAKRTGLTQAGISKQKKRILEKLKALVLNSKDVSRKAAKRET